MPSCSVAKMIALMVMFAAACLAEGCGMQQQAPPDRQKQPHGSTPGEGEQPSPRPAPKDEAWVQAMVHRLMDEPRQVPALGGYAAGPRGGPGSFGKLSAAEVAEIVAAIIYAGDTFGPPAIAPQLKYALIAVDISGESAFVPTTTAANPNPAAGSSTGMMQVTPSIWVPMFQQRANVPGLHHYDGRAWAPPDTQVGDMAHSIWDGIVVAAWAISEQAKAGGANPRAAEFHEEVGPMPRTWRTGLHCWNSGYPGARQGESDEFLHYIAMASADLQMLSLPISLLDASY